jgi:hypothetical protein
LKSLLIVKAGRNYQRMAGEKEEIKFWNETAMPAFIAKGRPPMYITATYAKQAAAPATIDPRILSQSAGSVTRKNTNE